MVSCRLSRFVPTSTTSSSYAFELEMRLQYLGKKNCIDRQTYCFSATHISLSAYFEDVVAVIDYQYLINDLIIFIAINIRHWCIISIGRYIDIICAFTTGHENIKTHKSKIYKASHNNSEPVQNDRKTKYTAGNYL